MKKILLILLLISSLSVNASSLRCDYDEDEQLRVLNNHKAVLIPLEPGIILHNIGERRFGRWLYGDVHIRLDDHPITGVDLTRDDLIAYAQEKITELGLDINLIFDGNLENGGVSIRYADIPSGACGNTRAISGFNLAGAPILRQGITISTTCLEELIPIGTNRTNALLNIFLHELLHGLFIDHIRIVKPMPVPLMNPYLSTDKPAWTYNDQQKLLDKYGQHGKLFTFKEEDVGKTMHLIYKDLDKSISVPITGTEMKVDWMQKNARPIKKVIQ